MPPKKQKSGKSKPTQQYQPSNAELEADVSIRCDPNDLLQTVISYKTKRGKK